MHPRVFIITGAMASGKSTVATALAKRFDRSAYVEGDAFLRMMVNGKAVMGPVLDAEALAQLSLRHQLATDAVRRFAHSGFTVVYEDILIGSHLLSAIERLSDLAPRVVVLAPSIEALQERDRARSKTGYSEKFPPNVLAEALVRETPRIGTWLDTSEMSAEDVVTIILKTDPADNPL
ncbi:AAA family ATPase [Rhizobium sp. LCM 4573]|uniref:AAA family ATPase n=1 Tax=Rhizobium sp. LCM 4573 TaxID=1848291 RepID=UPI0008D9AEA8|nr:AAA family ATPase [Rhizobium sp. LCM 4573]OHV76293.1 phosphotransferase [Rhizobium sp. LCM 4573]